MSMLLPIATALSLTATGPAAPVLCNVSPFLGGQGHNALLLLQSAIGGAGVVKIQGNPASAHAQPADSDTGWVDIVSLSSASPTTQEIDLPIWIRANVTTAGTGTLSVALEGVQ